MHVMEYFIIDLELDDYKDFGRYDISFKFLVCRSNFVCFRYFFLCVRFSFTESCNLIPWVLFLAFSLGPISHKTAIYVFCVLFISSIFTSA